MTRSLAFAAFAFVASGCTESMPPAEEPGGAFTSPAMQLVPDESDAFEDLKNDPRSVGTYRPGVHCDGPEPAAQVFKVTDYRETGDLDWYMPIQRAIRAAGAVTGAVVCFPRGTYEVEAYFRVGDLRYRQTLPDGTLQPRRAAIELTGHSDMEIRFAEGAVLEMVNVRADGSYRTNPRLNAQISDNADKIASIHGVLINEGASRITLNQVKIRWSRTAEARHAGDGVRIIGSHVKDRAVKQITLRHLGISGAPQTGVVAMGVHGLSAEDTFIRNTRADGFHNNAGHGGTRINRLSVIWDEKDEGEWFGDDALAFVTYYDPMNPVAPGSGPFTSPDHTTRNNQDSVVDNLYVQGGRGNGIRFSGASDVTVTNAVLVDRDNGIAFTSTMTTRIDFPLDLCPYGAPTNGAECNSPDYVPERAIDINQTTLASHDITVRGVRIVQPRRAGVVASSNHSDRTVHRMNDKSHLWFNFSFLLEDVLVTNLSPTTSQPGDPSSSIIVKSAYGKDTGQGMSLMKLVNFRGLSNEGASSPMPNRFEDARRVSFNSSRLDASVLLDAQESHCGTDDMRLGWQNGLTFTGSVIQCQ